MSDEISENMQKAPPLRLAAHEYVWALKNAATLIDKNLGHLFI